MAINNTKPRPSQHVNLKWIFGIQAALLLTISLLLLIFSILTSEKIAIPLVTIIAANQSSKHGLDEPKEIDEIRRQFLSTGETVFYPLPDKKVSITKSDLETLAPREIRLKIFRQIIEPFYFQRVDEQTKQQAGLLALINQDTHKKLQQFFFISLPLLFFTLGGLVYFSFGYGKLISPAVVLLSVSTIPAVLLTLIASSQPSRGIVEPTSLPHEIIQQVAKTIAPPYQLIFLLGIGLLNVVFFIKLLRKFLR